MEMLDRAHHDSNDRLAAGLAKISLVLRHHAWARGELSGVTPTQAQIVSLLAGRPAKGLSVSTIAAELAVSQPTISDAVAALHRKRLVAKAKSLDDSRVVRVRLTKTGRDKAQELVQWPDVLLRAIHTLDEGERTVFVKALVKMIHSLQESEQIPVSRMCPSCTYFRPNAHSGSAKPHHCAFVDASLAGSELRLDCPDHEMLSPQDRQKLYALFVEGKTPVGAVPTSSLYERRIS